ncbi:hypothetical protein ILUMI_09013, partial [Ignelater luminosus]
MELNIKPNANTKTKNKAFQADTEKLSNSQSINPSFNFSWGNTKNKITGQVLRKKQNSSHKPKAPINSNIQSEPQKESEKQPQPIQAKQNKSFKKQHSVKQQINKSNNNNQVKSSTQHNDFNAVNIKRKHKKDKAKALLNDEDGNKEQPASKSAQKSFSLFNQKPKDVYIAARSGKSVSEKVFTESGNKFSDLPIHKYLVSNLEKINFTTLTTVQEKAIPVVLLGKDVL